MNLNLDIVKSSVRKGRFQLSHLNWLIGKFEQQRELIKELKKKDRVQNFMKISNENLELQKEVEALKAENARLLVVEQAYESMKKAL